MDMRPSILRHLSRGPLSRDDLTDYLDAHKRAHDVQVQIASLMERGDVTQIGSRNGRDPLLRLTDQGRERLAEGRG